MEGSELLTFHIRKELSSDVQCSVARILQILFLLKYRSSHSSVICNVPSEDTSCVHQSINIK